MDAPATAADTTLLTRARAGDASAWSELLEAHRPQLTLLAQVQIGPGLRGKADAADVVQETFLEAHRDLPSFRGTTEAEFAAWLRQVLARNLANLLRRYFGTQARDPRRERPLADGLDRSSQPPDPALVAPQSTPSQRAVRGEELLRLAAALTLLSEDQRQVVELHHLQGLPVAEVAAQMGRTRAAVVGLLFRGLKKLRQLLREGGEGEV